MLSLAASLSGTGSLAEVIDASARASRDAGLDFGAELRRAAPLIEAADLSVTVTSIQGPIALEDYLRTRCVEAVVHGCDLVPAVVPDPEALAIAASALTAVLAARRADLVPAAEALAPLEWLDQATGRAPPAEVFEDLLPLMT